MFKPHLGQCKECPEGTSRFIVIKAGLCKIHNEKKKKANKVVKEVVRDMFTPERKKLNPVSNREKINIARKLKMYRKFDGFMNDQNKVYCSNCGQTKHLSHSHLVPVSFNKSLESVIENIVYHCTFRPGFISCHDLFETHDPEVMQQMKDYNSNMEKIKTLDPTYYNILNNKKK